MDSQKLTQLTEKSV